MIDGLSSLFAVAFPKTIDAADYKQTPEKKKNDVAQWAAGRRWAVLGDVISSLTKLAALRNIAILLTSQATIKITAETGAILHPSLASTVWDNSISAHIVLFRDWAFQLSKESCHRVYVPKVRFASVLKAAGISHTGVDVLVPFVIEKVGSQSTMVSNNLLTKSSMVSGASTSNHKVTLLITPGSQYLLLGSVKATSYLTASQKTTRLDLMRNLGGRRTSNLPLMILPAFLNNYILKRSGETSGEE